MVKKKFLPSNKTLTDKVSCGTVILFIAFIVYCLILFVPIIWSCFASFMTNESFREIFGSPKNYGAMREFTFDNFINAWNNIEIVVDGYPFHIGDLFVNSIIYSFIFIFIDSIIAIFTRF